MQKVTSRGCLFLLAFFGCAVPVVAQPTPVASVGDGSSARADVFAAHLDQLEGELLLFQRALGLVEAGQKMAPGVAEKAGQWGERLVLLSEQSARLPAEQAAPLLARARALRGQTPDAARLVPEGAQVPVSLVRTWRVETDSQRVPSEGSVGAIMGTVTNAATAAPIQGVEVDVLGSDGHLVDFAHTDAAGVYTVGDLPAGDYYVATQSSLWADELYDDIACNPTCSLGSGTSVHVSAGATTGGIDFALGDLGKITGTITDFQTGDPLASALVVVYTSATAQTVSVATTDSAGTYVLGGLPTGTYVAVASRFSHRQELYDGIPCQGGPGHGCLLGFGTPIAVAEGATTGGIDFALRKLGEIAGTVKDSSTDQPIASLGMVAVNSDGHVESVTATDALGAYTLIWLAPGSYFVATPSGTNYHPEVYDDIPCGPPCDPTLGTPVPVNLDSTTTGIDFALDLGGSIAGNVSPVDPNGLRVEGHARLWNASGTLVAERLIGHDGSYLFTGLVAGSYFVSVRPFAGYVGKLYDDLPCNPSCDPTAGAPVVVNLGVTTGGIDFVLDRLGTFTGTITDEITGDPILSAGVLVWDGGGMLLDTVYLDLDGTYTVHSLQPGSYYVTSFNFGTHLDEIYRDVPCPGGFPNGCSLGQATPVAVSINHIVRHVDFVLQPLASGIAGAVTDAQGQPLGNLFIDVWNPSGQLVASRLSNTVGRYLIELPLGTYYVSTSNGNGYGDEVYDDLACPGSAYNGGCDPTTGTAVTLTGPGQSLATGIDFALEQVRIFGDGFESGDWAQWTVAVGGS